MNRLCPVHWPPGLAHLVLEVPAGSVLIGGLPALLREWSCDWPEVADLLDGPRGTTFLAVLEELEDDHPRQLIGVWISAPDPDEFPQSTTFTELSPGVFSIPHGFFIERNNAGNICVYEPELDQHNVILPLPASGL